MSGELILVIDDSREIIRHLTERLLPTFGYNSIHASDGRVGLDLIRREKPDLVMIDLNLPEMTGLDVLQKMAYESIEIPTILMTGYGSEKSAIEAFRLGVRDYLIKPFTVDEVLETINRALMEKRLLHDKQQLTSELQRGNGEMRRRLAQVNNVIQVGKSIMEQSSLNMVAKKSLKAAAAITNGEESVLWLLDKENEGDKFRTFSNLTNTPTEPPSLELSPEHPLLTPILRDGRNLRESSFSGPGIKLKTGYLARAMLFVPLILQEKTIGILGVTNRDAPRAFGEHEENMLNLLADFVTIAIDHVQTLTKQNAGNSALPSQNSLGESLSKLNHVIASPYSLDEVIRFAIQLIHAHWEIEATSVWLLNETRQSLRALANTGVPADLINKLEIPIGVGFVGHVAASGNWIYTNQASSHKQHFAHADQQTGFNTESLLCVPLIFRKKVIGALELVNKKENDFNNEDVERALKFSTLMSLAIANALLHKRSQVQKTSLDANKSDFVATVSHDLRAPLNSVLGFAQAIENAGTLNEKQHQYIQQIRRAAKRMSSLVNDLLNLARVRNGIGSQREACDMSLVVRDVVTELQGKALASQVALNVHTNGSQSIVRGDLQQLHQAVSNLVDNAIKYTHPETSVHVSLGANNGSVTVSVSDEGAGIPLIEQGRIFEQFYRSDNNSHLNGTGLGLPLASTIAQSHGGMVRVKSEAGAGTTFVLELPAISQKASLNLIPEPI